MEPNRYWFLYFGLLFVFLGSKVGQAFRVWVSGILRAFLYAALALAAAAAAKLLWEVSFLLLKFANAHKQRASARTRPKPREPREKTTETAKGNPP